MKESGKTPVGELIRMRAHAIYLERGGHRGGDKAGRIGAAERDGPSSSIERDEHRQTTVDAHEAAFLNELVAGLTAARSESMLRWTIDRWRVRVLEGGLDPDALIDLFRHTRPSHRDAIPGNYAWAHVDKRELVLVSIDVYERNGFSPRPAMRCEPVLRAVDISQY